MSNLWFQRMREDSRNHHGEVLHGSLKPFKHAVSAQSEVSVINLDQMEQSTQRTLSGTDGSGTSL